MMLYDQGAYSKIAKTQRYVFMGGFLIGLSMTRFDLLYWPSIRHIRHPSATLPPPFRHRL
jgi:hypothetical protein